MLKALVLEDNDPVAERLCRILVGWDRVQTTRKCGLLNDALNLIESENFDLFYADLHLPDGSGIDAIRMMSQHQPECQTIVVSALKDRSFVVAALQAGAFGYILKDDDSVSIISASEAILAQQSPISVGIARHLINLIQDETVATNVSHDALPSLTERELEILNAIAKGLSNKEVAKVFGISIQTVPVHIRNIYRKLQATNRSEAAYEARRLGLIEK